MKICIAILIIFQTLFAQPTLHTLSITPEDTQIKSILTPYLNTLISSELMHDVSQTLTNHCAQSGYPFAQFTLTPSSDTLSVTINKGELYYFGPLYNADSSKSTDSILNRFSLTPVHTPFSEVTLKKIQERFNRSPLFTLLPYPDILKHPNRSILYPAFHIQDNAINSAELILSYSNDKSDFEGKALISLYNIAGTMRELTFHYFSDERATDISLHYREPWVLNSDASAVIEVSLVELDTTSKKSTIESGALFDLSFEQSFGLYIGSKIQRELNSASQQYYWSRFDLTRDTRNRRTLASSGSFSYASLQITTGEQTTESSQFSFTHTGSFTWYQSVIPSVIIQPKLQWGTIFSNSPLKPIESFLLGGAQSIRGFRERTFITQSYLSTPTELHLTYGTSPTNQPTNSLYLFIDPLVHNPSISNKWLFDIGYGVGIQQHADIFTIGVAFASNPSTPILKSLIHVSAKSHF